MISKTIKTTSFFSEVRGCFFLSYVITQDICNKFIWNENFCRVYDLAVIASVASWKLCNHKNSLSYFNAISATTLLLTALLIYFLFSLPCLVYSFSKKNRDQFPNTYFFQCHFFFILILLFQNGICRQIKKEERILGLKRKKKKGENS